MEVVAITRGHILLGAHLMRNIKTLKRCSLYLATCLRLEVFVRGQQIYHFGEPTVGFFIVSEGAVDVMKENDSWDTTLENSLARSSSHTGQMNNTIRPIGHFGAWSRKYKCRVDSAVAVEDSHVYRCSVEDMFEVLERMSEMDAADFVKDILV
jgi:CRP-like cAMP-binding protein